MFFLIFISWVFRVSTIVLLNIFLDRTINIEQCPWLPLQIRDFSDILPTESDGGRIIMVAIRIWKQTGYGTVVYLAILQGEPGNV